MNNETSNPQRTGGQAGCPLFGVKKWVGAAPNGQAETHSNFIKARFIKNFWTLLILSNLSVRSSFRFDRLLYHFQIIQ